MLNVLVHRVYRHLFLAQVIALFGTGLTTVTLPASRSLEEAHGVWRRVTHGMRIYLMTPRLRGLLH